jgi:hypothetical protein
MAGVVQIYPWVGHLYSNFTPSDNYVSVLTAFLYVHVGMAESWFLVRTENYNYSCVSESLNAYSIA